MVSKHFGRGQGGVHGRGKTSAEKAAEKVKNQRDDVAKRETQRQIREKGFGDRSPRK